ncbi:MAG TPA: ATPase [Novosphingobium sp.]|nr:ATPase [Novosphingobium sp.]
MAGENRIIAFGTGGNDGKADDQEQTQDETAFETEVLESGDAKWDDAWIASDEADAAGKPSAWILPMLAMTAVLAWTAFFLTARLPQLRAGVLLDAVPELVTEWCVPVLLVGVVWLLALRHSAREGKRFGDIARTLSTESALLEQRLTTVNRELSLAREFIASQSRDLEALGRIATERLSEHAGRLQDLIRDNGSRVESISTVSQAALENMEKLRGQLPVIASSAKDVTNNIGNAGRAAHAQLEDMISGFNRLNEFGTASERQVQTLRGAVETTLGEFAIQCEKLEDLAERRFTALVERGEEFRTELDKHEIEALAAVRTRAAALGDEIERTRVQLDAHEAESLTSLRARLASLRDESDVVSRALRDGERRAIEDWRSTFTNLQSAQEAAVEAIVDAQRKALEGLSDRISGIEADAARLDRTLADRSARVVEESAARFARQEEQERDAIERFREVLAQIDGGIEERLDGHRVQTEALHETARAIMSQLADFEARLRTIAENSVQGEEVLSASLAALTDRLTAARATLTATDGDIEKLTEGSIRLLELIQASAKQAHSALPEALSVSESRLDRLNQGIALLISHLREASRGGEALAGEISSSGAHLQSLTEKLSSAHAAIADRGSAHGELLTELRATLESIDKATSQAADRAGSELRKAIDALDATIVESIEAIEVQSTTRISAVAEKLGQESAEAIDRAMRTRVAEVSGQLDQAVAHAAGATREATIQLRDQLAKVDELVGNLENRVAHARSRAEEQVDNDFSRRVALISESLNSNAIDIANALSTDVSDTAWAAYLRGDRGIFTRRAVRLLDAGQAKAIQQIFERDEAFREHVSRYIHDFEAILRQILSTRDGNALGVTLLSSDMGKLYVALAQAIERLRS